MPWWIALLNTVAALLSVVFAAITLVRPNQFIPPTLRRQTDRFAAATSASRSSCCSPRSRCTATS